MEDQLVEFLSALADGETPISEEEPLSNLLDLVKSPIRRVAQTATIAFASCAPHEEQKRLIATIEALPDAPRRVTLLGVLDIFRRGGA